MLRPAALALALLLVLCLRFAMAQAAAPAPTAAPATQPTAKMPDLSKFDAPILRELAQGLYTRLATLEREIAAARAENARLTTEGASLRAENARLTGELKTVRAELAKLQILSAAGPADNKTANGAAAAGPAITSLQTLLGEIPRELLPETGDVGTAALAKSVEWLNRNLHGRAFRAKLSLMGRSNPLVRNGQVTMWATFYDAQTKWRGLDMKLVATGTFPEAEVDAVAKLKMLAVCEVSGTIERISLSSGGIQCELKDIRAK